MIPEEKDIYSIVFNQNLANTFFFPFFANILFDS